MYYVRSTGAGWELVCSVTREVVQRYSPAGAGLAHADAYFLNAARGVR